MVQQAADRTEPRWQSAIALGPFFRTTTATLGTPARIERLAYTSAASHPVHAIAQTLQKLNEFVRLEAGWDSYAAEPVSELAINSARSLLLALPGFVDDCAGSEFVPFAVVPLANGGIQIEWRAEDRGIEVEIDPVSGEYSAIFYDGPSHPVPSPEPRLLSRRALTEHIVEVLAR
jgi:hypothetical protein